MKIKDVIVSDDIRFELANKFSIIGLYFDRIQIDSRGNSIKFPLMLKLGLMIRIYAGKEDVFPQDFKIRYHLNGGQVASVGGAINLINKEGRDLVLPIVIHIPLQSLGKLDFDISFTHNNKLTYEFKNIYPIDVVELKEQTDGI